MKRVSLFIIVCWTMFSSVIAQKLMVDGMKAVAMDLRL